MVYYDDERDQEPKEIETIQVEEPGPCCICRRPGQRYGCFSCGQPVCYNQADYFGESPCGGWILDTWHPMHPEGNEFYCNLCLCANLVQSPLAVVNANEEVLAFGFTDQTLLITGANQIWRLSEDDTRTLIAYLYSSRGELFGKRYDPDAEPEPVAVSAQGDDDLLGDLDSHPF